MTPERLRRERTAAVLLAIVAGLLGLLAASRTWAAADVSDALAGRVQLRLSGRQVAPVVPAVSVVLFAAGAAVLLARRLGRAVAGLVLVLAGAACATAAVSAARTPGTAVAAEVARATGRSAGPQVVVTTTGWPWVALVAGVLAVMAGVLVVVGSRRWSAPSDRFESLGAAPADKAAVDDASGAPGDRPAGGSADLPPASVDPEPADAWDALTRGEDPTR